MELAIQPQIITFTRMSREALQRKIRSMAKALTFPKREKRDDPEDGSQSTGVTAPLKPLPPALSSAATKALPRSSERKTA
ncbi:MAG TPA: hypothetical protein VHC20_08085 [Candidatus Paceibacterota bacterium]|nr:hypothetical protein [Candidatus Paceibacterota bacterium]